MFLYINRFSYSIRKNFISNDYLYHYSTLYNYGERKLMNNFFTELCT